MEDKNPPAQAEVVEDTLNAASISNPQLMGARIDVRHRPGQWHAEGHSQLQLHQCRTDFFSYFSRKLANHAPRRVVNPDNSHHELLSPIRDNLSSLTASPFPSQLLPPIANRKSKTANRKCLFHSK